MARISFGPKKLVPVEGSSGLPGLVRYKLSSRTLVLYMILQRSEFYVVVFFSFSI